MSATVTVAVDLAEVQKVQRAAENLVTALRDMANARHAAPNEGYPGAADIDDLTDQAESLASMIEGLA